MPKGDKYAKLGKYLENLNEDEIKLPYEMIEKIIGDKLPKSAYTHAQQWWSNCGRNSQAVSWMDVSYETSYVSDTYQQNVIIFKKKE